MATKVKPSRLQVTGTPQAGQVPVYVDEDTFQWGAGGGSGDVVGPASSTDGHLAVFDGATGKIIKDGGAPTPVVDALNSTSATSALSANQGKVLNDKISDLFGLGKFLSLWDATTGLPDSFPLSTPYTYTTGDYFLVETISSATPPVNYKPNGSSYTGTASTTVETDELEVGDVYIYDGSAWLLQSNHGKTVSFVNIAGDPYDNTNLSNALSAKADDSAVVKLTGNQTIAGTKTFSTSPVVPSKTAAATNTGTAIATEAQVYAKQDKLTAQTAYTTKGTSTKVPTITTNTLGQVTAITETSIAFPVTSVNGSTGAVVLDADDISDSTTTNKFVTQNDKDTWDSKQDELVSEVNIRTINGTSILGSGDITTPVGPTYTAGTGISIVSDAITNTGVTSINGNTGAVTLTIPTVNDATLTIQKNGTDVQTFTANQSTNATANITVPTDTGDLTNGAGFLTSSTGVTSFNGSTGAVTYTAPVTSVNGNTGAVTVNDVKSSATAPSTPTEGMLWYDTTNDVLKSYDGANWNEVGAGAADINTKTFYISSTSDTTNAQAALDWYRAGKNPIVIYDSKAYFVHSFTNNINTKRLLFYGETDAGVDAQYSVIKIKTLYLMFNSGFVITSIVPQDMVESGFLGTATNYSPAYTPLYDGSPATKKYVDDHAFTAATGGVKIFDFPSVGDDISDIMSWISGGGNVVLVSGAVNGTRYYYYVYRHTTNSAGDTLYSYYENVQKVISADQSHQVVSLTNETFTWFEPSNAGSTGNVLTKTASGYQWAAPSGGGDVLVSSQANNILTSGMKIWAGTQANYEALSTYDSNTVYLTIEQ